MEHNKRTVRDCQNYRNTCYFKKRKRKKKLQETIKSAVSASAAGMGKVSNHCINSFSPRTMCGAEEHFPTLTSDAAAQATRCSAGSCSTPCLKEPQWKRICDKGKWEKPEGNPSPTKTSFKDKARKNIHGDKSRSIP